MLNLILKLDTFYSRVVHKIEICLVAEINSEVCENFMESTIELLCKYTLCHNIIVTMWFVIQGTKNLIL